MVDEFYKFGHYVIGGSKQNVDFEVYSTETSDNYFYVILKNKREVYDSRNNNELYSDSNIAENKAREKGEEFLNKI